MEEMHDAAHVLAHATPRSLVILDELGRGTATHDGVALAAAVLQHLVCTTQALTLFVTHYPEVRFGCARSIVLELSSIFAELCGICILQLV